MTTDYKERAARILFDMGDVTCKPHYVALIAEALEAAEKRGRVAGLREAAEVAWKGDARHSFREISRRVEEVERS